jgi:hypothetical protein
MHRHVKKIVAAVTVAALSAPALAEDCTDTTFSVLAPVACTGSFSGNIHGAPSELSYLGSVFGGSFTYAGKSDDGGHGPFTSSPSGATNGTLTFDTPIVGNFVIGLKAANNYSYYFFNAVSSISSLTFDSTSGVATNKHGIAQGLSHASLYVQSLQPVPEPETYALMLAGLASVVFVSRRRKAD